MKLGLLLCLVTVAAAVAGSRGSGPSAAVPPRGAAQPAALTPQLRAAKAATARYQSTARAVADGYAAPPPNAYEPYGHCAASPPDQQLPGASGGGMGIHFDNTKLIKKKGFDIRHPEQLNYLPTGGKLRLVAIEFFQPDADQKLTTSTDRPKLFGRPFDGPMPGHYPGQAVHYDLHVWLFAKNPNGIFSTWNPSLHCP